MSIFKTFTAQETDTLLISNTPLYSSSPNNGISINNIAVTNSDTALTHCDVEIFIKPTSGSNIPIMKVKIPRAATVIYDTPFSIMNSGDLKITTSNASAITVIIN